MNALYILAFVKALLIVLVIMALWNREPKGR